MKNSQVMKNYYKSKKFWNVVVIHGHLFISSSWIFHFFHIFSISKMTEDDANIESSQFTLFAPIYKAYSI